MARVYGIKKRLQENNVDKNLIKEIIGDEDMVNVITRMEKLLEPDMMCHILDSCGCTGGKEYLKQCEKIGREIADKTIMERVNHVNDESDSYKIMLNDDNTLTVKMFFMDNGRHGCVCKAAVKNGVKVSDLALEENHTDDYVMPLSYCLCCAGSSRLHLQLKLGIKLKTKEIISSPINSNGKKPCEFIYEII